jgi:stress response protein YsnF
MPDDRVTQLGRVAVAALAAVLREDDPPPRTRLSPGRAVAVGAVVGTLGRVAAQRGARLLRQRLDEHAERIAPQDERMPPMEGAMTRSEEELEARTGRRQRGRVRLRKYVVTEQVQRTIPARREEICIEEAPPSTQAGGPATEEAEPPDIEEIVLYKEVPVIENRVVPAERVRASRTPASTRCTSRNRSGRSRSASSTAPSGDLEVT